MKYESSIFPNQKGLFARYDELKNTDPFTGLREKFLRNYNRRDWQVTKNGRHCRTEPNFGQFKFKIDAAIGAFVMVLTERKDWVKIEPRYPEPGIPSKPFSNRVSSSYHKYCIRPWCDRYLMEINAAFDMVMWGKAIEFWPSPGCVYTENVPVENVFPDSRASMNTKEWSYFFLKKEFTIAQLKAIYVKKDNTLLEDFDKKYLKKMIDYIETYGAYPKATQEQAMRSGEQDASIQDMAIPVIYCFVKDNFESDKPVSCYAFHADLAEYVDQNKAKVEKGTGPHTRLMMSKDEYATCISECIAVRAHQISRSYWKFNSLAQQIYLSTQLYDKSMNLMLRLSRRHAIMYLKSDSPDTQKKLMKQNDEEVQIVDSDVNFVQLGTQNSNIREIMEITRQVMIDTDNGQAISQAPGSQNTKGYAITAEEARLRAQQEGESQALSFKVLMNQDVPLYREIYRRFIENDDEKLKKAYSKFKKEMEMYNVDDDYWKFDDVYFVPSYTNGGSQFARLANANAIIEVLSRQPVGMGQEQAQKEAIAALVGVDNVSEYIQDRTQVNPVVLKAGRENEDLDNPVVNPANVQVLPDDKHLQEIPIHVADYKFKLEQAGKMIQNAAQYPNRFKQLIAVTMASDLIVAQDLKGAHISAHIKAASNSKENMESIGPIIDEFNKLQQDQDRLTNQVTQLTEQLDKQMEEQTVQNAELAHKQKMFQLEEEHTGNMNNIATSKAISQKDMADERTKNKYATEENKAVLDSAVRKTKAELELTNQQLKDEQSIETEKRKAAAKNASGPAGTSSSSS